MTTPILCVLLAWLLAYLPKIPLSVAMARQPEGYDNLHPRAQQDKLSGFGARARGAHLNSFEVFPPFAAAVIIAHITGADASHAAVLSLTFVVSRALYVLTYLVNLGTVRSALWGVGMLAILGLFLLPLA